MLRVSIFVYLVATTSSSIAQQLNFIVDESKVIQQGPAKDGYCGPACILNAMQFGSPFFHDSFVKLENEICNQSVLESVIEKSRNWKSSVRGKGQLFNKETGFSMCSEDTPLLFRKLFPLKEGVKINGQIVRQRDEESSRSHLEKIHSLITQSFSAGLPPIGSFTLYAAYAKPKERNPKWHRQAKHSVCIVGVEEKLPNQALGFCIVVLDPLDGRLKNGYLFAEKIRPFGADIGSEKYAEWVKGTPFLNFVCPAMSLSEGDIAWSQRTTVLLTHLTGCFDAFEEPLPPLVRLDLGFVKIRLNWRSTNRILTRELHPIEDLE